MGIYEEQINERKRLDSLAEKTAEERLRSAVSTGRNGFSCSSAGGLPAAGALALIMSYLGLPEVQYPRYIDNLDDCLEYLMRNKGVGYHKLKLDSGWGRRAAAPMLALDRDGIYRALVPGEWSGCRVIDEKTGNCRRLSAEMAAGIQPDACEFFISFPNRPLAAADALFWLIRMMRGAALSHAVTLSIFAALLSAASPVVTYAVFASAIPGADAKLAGGLFVFLAAVLIAQALLRWARDRYLTSVSVRLAASWRSALLMRILSMPASFFRDYASNTVLVQLVKGGDVPQYLAEALLDLVLMMSGAFFAAAPLFFFAPMLGLTALCFLLLSLCFASLTFYLRVRLAHRVQASEVRDEGVLTEFLRGIQKIKLSGSEKRIFSRWADNFANSLALKYRAGKYVRLGWLPPTVVLSLALPAAFIVSFKSGLDTSSFMAYNSALGIITANLLQLFDTGKRAELIQPFLSLLEPLLKARPESQEGVADVRELLGSITLENVTFRYYASGDPILNKLDLKINAGEFVAITGKSECGKSTILRLLLGFEKPDSGAIYYDQMPIAKLNLSSLRKKIGVVLQNGSLFPGSIFDNIALTQSGMTREAAWKAASMACVADDIKAMPMGMETLVQEAGGGVSGGQRQRLLLARAFAGRPRIMFLDEATSALDNITQKNVMDNLASLNCTRIAIAHRLSTVRQCDRIIVMDKGRIAEEGTYDELIARNGIFAELAERQRTGRPE